MSYDEKTTEAQYESKAVMVERDNGHVREMTTALDENVLRLQKVVEVLSMRLDPILLPRNIAPDDDSNPTPIRCPIADELAKLNDRVYQTIKRIEAVTQSVDI